MEDKEFEMIKNDPTLWKGYEEWLDKQMEDKEFEMIKNDPTLWKGYEEWLDKLELQSFFEREHEAENKFYPVD